MRRAPFPSSCSLHGCNRKASVWTRSRPSKQAFLEYLASFLFFHLIQRLITYTTLLTNSQYVEEVSSAIQDCFKVSIFLPKSPKKPALGLIIVPGTNFKIFSNDSMDGRMWRVLNISLAEGKCFLIMGTTKKFRFNHHHNWTLLFWKKLKGHLEWRTHFVPLKILFTSFSSLP